MTSPFFIMAGPLLALGMWGPSPIARLDHHGPQRSTAHTLLMALGCAPAKKTRHFCVGCMGFARLTPAELEQVIKIVGRSPRGYPPGAYDALKGEQHRRSTEPPAQRLSPKAAAKEQAGRVREDTDRVRRGRIQAAGVTLMSTSCGKIGASVMKDGWTYALKSHDGECRWQFPASLPHSAHCKFPPSGAHVHGDTDYKRPGAAWGDVLAITTGGEALVTSAGVTGYGGFRALNVCVSSPLKRVRWIADVPNSSGGGYSLSVLQQ